MSQGRTDTWATRMPARRSSLITAIVVGLVAGALACTGITGSSEGRADDVDPPSESTMSGPPGAHADPAHPPGPTNDHDVPGLHHAGMACLVDVTLRVADLEVAIVTEPSCVPETPPARSYSSGPEPPVPRPSS